MKIRQRYAEKLDFISPYARQGRGSGQTVRSDEPGGIMTAMSTTYKDAAGIEGMRVAGKLASEVLDYVADEGVQIYGGMGYSAEAPMDRAYRDSRINRIFEGTNEINRLLTVGTLVKKALKGELDLMAAAKMVQQELMAIPDFGAGLSQGFLEEEKEKLARLKKAFLLVAGAAVQKLMLQLEEEQEIMLWLADMLIEIYASESALLRSLKIREQNGDMAARKEEICSRLLLHQASEKIAYAGRQALESFASGDELKMMMMGLKRFTKQEPLNTTALRRELLGLI
jgi:alkylation response protein AidB-like acyl-CoA dehydrogenase